MKVGTIVSLILFMPALLFAAAEEHGGHDAIPWAHLIFPQIFNFVLVAIGLGFVLKKPLKEHFAEKAQSFERLKLSAEATKEEAQKINSQARQRLSLLEDSTQRSIEEAKAESQALRKQMVGDAESQAQKLAEEALRLSQFELDRAIASLRSELVTNSIRFAESKMKEKMDSGAQEKLNKDFLVKVQGVRL